MVEKIKQQIRYVCSKYRVPGTIIRNKGKVCFDLKVIYSNTVNWPAIPIQFYSVCVCLHGASPINGQKAIFHTFLEELQHRISLCCCSPA